MPKRAREYDRLPPRKLMRVGPRPDYSFALDTLMRAGRLPLEIAQMIMRIAAQPVRILLPTVSSLRLHSFMHFDRSPSVQFLTPVQFYSNEFPSFDFPNPEALLADDAWLVYPPAFLRNITLQLGLG